MRIVKLDRTSKVKWQESPQSLTSQQPSGKVRTSDVSSNKSSGSGLSRFDPQSSSYIQPFPIDNLAPISQQPYPPPYNPPTPPPESEPDTMDWTPTQPSFKPVPVRNIVEDVAGPPTPTPFYGRLPAAPQSQAQKLRNPQNQPSFIKASVERQQNFFESMTRRFSPREKHPRNDTGPGNERPCSIEMAPPKFFPSNDSHAATGLENLFDSSFSLKDEPMEIRIARERQQQLARRNESSGPGAWARIAGILSLGVASLAWNTAITVPRYAYYFQLAALGVTTAIAGRALFEAMGKTKAFWSFSDIFVYAMELVISMVLGSTVSSYDSLRDKYDKIGMVLLGGMMVQEMWLFISAQKQSVRQHSTTGPVLPPAPKISDSQIAVLAPISPPLSQPQVQQELPAPPQLQLHEPRMTRSRSKRESIVPSTSLSGLSIGNADSECGSPVSTSSFSTVYGGGRYGSEMETVSRQTRSRQGLGAFDLSRR